TTHTPILQALPRWTEPGEHRPREHGDRTRAPRPVPRLHLRRVPGPDPVAAEAVRLSHLEGTAQARARRPPAARHPPARQEGLRRSVRRVVARPAQPPAA